MPLRVTSHVQKDGNGFFGSCVEFPGVIVGEMTENACLEQTREAVLEHFEILMSEGISIPNEVINRNSNETHSADFLVTTSKSGLSKY